MASNDDVEVKLISESFIKPKFQVEESKTPHYLLGTDSIFLSLRYMQTTFLFNKPNTNDFNINSFVEKMKQSFSHALVYYYPLAGRFTTVTYPDENACSVHVDCNKGPGARFIHASCVHATVSDIAGHTACMLPAIGPFCNLGDMEVVNYDGHTRALLGLQTVSLSNKPIFKPFLLKGCNLLQKLPYLEPNKFIRQIDNGPRFKQKIFHFSLSSITNLKKRVNSEWPEGLGRISSYQALAALVWVSINRAQKASAHAYTTAICYVPINCRALFDPPLSPAQFGNQAQPLMVTREVGELIENGPGQAAKVIHQGILGYDQKVATQCLKAMMEKPYVLYLDDFVRNKDNCSMINFTGSSKFDIYGVDFGLGKPVAVWSGDTCKRDGKVVIRMARDGIGSIDLEVCLFTETMIALELDQEFMEFASSP
ncbi:hypothetical protein KSS87_002533 [Heliosperma pusillum]|nr:hypothetical protein KSS87_002533 [Heliosperma pusillum]